MAVTLVSRPTTPNVTGTKLLFEVSGSDISHPQYSYVMDIYLSGSNERIDRQFQQPNPNGVAQFNPAEVLRGQLDYDNFWKITGSVYPINAAKTFDLRFGEAYGTSISSSITVYTGSSNNYLQVFPGVLNPNNVFTSGDITTYYNDGYNFFTASFDPASGPASSNRGTVLSNHPAYIYDSVWIEDFGFFTKDDYVTATQLKNLYTGADLPRVVGYLQVGNSLSGITGSVMLPDYVDSEFPDYRFNTMPVGPKNLIERDNGWKQYIESGSINYIEINASPDFGDVEYYIIDNVYNNFISPVDVDYPSAIERGDEDKPILPLNKEYIQFAFVNSFGFYDYYNIYNPLKRNTEVTRDNVSLPKVNYSGNVSTYSIETGGDYIYQRDTNDFYSITTEWLGKTKANWLEEMLESPEVYVRQGDDYVPVVITNTSYEHNNVEARNKLFQYTIEFVPSNGRTIEQEIAGPGRKANLTKWTSKFNTELEFLGAFPELQRPNAEVGIYSPYWRGLAPVVSYFIAPVGQPGPRQSTPQDFIYVSASVPFESVLLISGSEAATTANFDLEIYGDDDIIFTTSSVFFVGDQTPSFADYVYFVPPYTASFTESYYQNIVWSGSLTKWTPPTCESLPWDPTLSGSLTLNHWYDFTDCSTMTFKIYEVTSITDKGNAAVNPTLTVNTGSYYSGPSFLGSISGSAFNSNRFDWKGLETSNVPPTMLVTGSYLTYVTIFEITGGSQGRPVTPGDPAGTNGTVVYAANSSYIGHRSIQPARYDSSSYGPQPANARIIPADGNLKIGGGIQRLATPTVFVGNAYDAGSGSMYMVSNAYNIDQDGTGGTTYAGLYVNYNITGSAAIGGVIGQTSEYGLTTRFAVGYNPIDDEDVSRTNIKHVMIFDDILTQTQLNNLYAAYLDSLNPCNINITSTEVYA